jgi:hypothetical protein
MTGRSGWCWSRAQPMREAFQDDGEPTPGHRVRSTIGPWSEQADLDRDRRGP